MGIPTFLPRATSQEFAMLQSSAVSVPSLGPRRTIHPHRPFAFSFAVSATRAEVEQIIPGETVVVAIHSGRADAGGRESDWFLRRVPALPAWTGPIHIAGAVPGDLLEFEVLAIAPQTPLPGASLMVTVTVPAATGEWSGAVQAAVSSGGLVRLPVARSGGLVSFGPVLTRQAPGRALPADPIAAAVTVRCVISAA
jgi:acetamidase/formamidase